MTSYAPLILIVLHTDELSFDIEDFELCNGKSAGHCKVLIQYNTIKGGAIDIP